MAVRRSRTRSALAAGAENALPPSCPTSAWLAPKPRVRLMIAHRFRARLWRSTGVLRLAHQGKFYEGSSGVLWPGTGQAADSCCSCLKSGNARSKWITRSQRPQLALRAIRRANVRFGIQPSQSRLRANDRSWVREVSSQRFTLRHRAISALVITGLITQSGAGDRSAVGRDKVCSASGSGATAWLVAARPSFSRSEREVE